MMRFEAVRLRQYCILGAEQISALRSIIESPSIYLPDATCQVRLFPMFAAPDPSCVDEQELKEVGRVRAFT